MDVPTIYLCQSSIYLSHRPPAHGAKSLSSNSLFAFIIVSNILTVVLSAYSTLVNYIFFFDSPTDDELVNVVVVFAGIG